MKLTSLAPMVQTRLESKLKPQSRQTTRALHTGSKAWRRQRMRVLVRDNFTCAVCGRYGDQVDHINGDASIDVPDWALQTMCVHDHSAKTMREMIASPQTNAPQ